MQTTIDREARVIEDTFILGDQSYVYSEQDWSLSPGAADDAAFETRNAYWHYMGAMLAKAHVVEDGRQLGRPEMRHRVIELAGGLFALSPHVSSVIPLAKRAVASILILNGVAIPHDLL